MNKLSGGQQRRLDVAIALAGDPELLFLDEPTTGFDPSARRNAWEIVKNLTALGKTVFLTTHFMDEAQYLADRVAVIAQRRDRRRGPAATLGRTRSRCRRVIRFRLAGGRRSCPTLGQVADRRRRVRGSAADDPTRPLHELTGWALERGVAARGPRVARPTLEDVYLELTGGGGDRG